MLEFKKIDENEKLIKKYKSITNIISVFRILILIVLVVFVVLLISLKEYILYSILSSISLLVFIIFMLYTNRYYDKYLSYLNIKKCYIKHNDRRAHNLNKFYDLGNDFINKNDYKSQDLDLFGKNSLFQYLSIAKTKEGRNKLKEYLTLGNINKGKYQELIYDLKDNEDIIKLEASLESFDSSAKRISKDNLNYTIDNKIKFKFYYFIPLLSFIALIIYSILALTISLNPYFIFLFLGLNFVTTKVFIRNDIFDLEASSLYKISDSYLKFSKEVLKYESNNAYFNHLKENINKEISNLEKLRSLYSILATRKNLVFNLISNILFVFDFYIIIIYNNLTKKCNKLDNLFNSVNELEVILSFLNLVNDNDIYTKAIDSNFIEIVNGIHPLICNCIPNSIKIESGIILTGSNMSGKTTFMRMVGINQILKEACGISMAESFKSPSIKTFTSLRINDLLSEGISTFYAEILRMKEINKSIKEGVSLILIDEIFKGTNHDERIKGSLLLIEKLLEHKALFIISTHDFELCDAKGITNYHFSEDYIDDKISFDYKIKKGKSDSKNALYLLHLADII